MQVTAVKFDIPRDANGALLAFADVTVDGTFVIKGVRIIKTAVRLFVAMPSLERERLCVQPGCGSKAYVGAMYCPRCGVILPVLTGEQREMLRAQRRDVIHPLSVEARAAFENEVLAYWRLFKKTGTI